MLGHRWHPRLRLWLSPMPRDSYRSTIRADHDAARARRCNASSVQMRLVLLPFAAGAVVSLAGAAAATPPRAASTTVAAPVRRLAADGTTVAVHTLARNGCDRILLWTPGARPTSVSLENCQHPSTGAAVTSLALFGKRPAWAGYAGGNTREFTVRTIAAGKPLLISLYGVPVEDSRTVKWRVAPGGSPLAFEENGELWRIVPLGGRACPHAATTVNMCAAVPATGALLGVGGGRLLVRAEKQVVLLRQNGSAIARLPDAPEAVTDGTIVVELNGRTLTSGAHRISIPAGSHLAGTARGVAATTHAGTTVVVRLRDGRKKTFSGSVAALSSAGLYTATGTTIAFRPWTALGL